MCNTMVWRQGLHTTDGGWGEALENILEKNLADEQHEVDLAMRESVLKYYTETASFKRL